MVEPIQKSSVLPQLLAVSGAQMALAFFAGSPRLVQYFSGATRGGLMVQAGITGMASIGYEVLLKSDNENARFFALIHGAILAPLLLKCIPKNETIAHSFTGAFKFAAAELIPTTILTVLFNNIKIVQNPDDPDNDLTLEEAHEKYAFATWMWNGFTEAKRTDLSLKFFENDFSVISLESQVDWARFLPFRDVATLTENQVGWYADLFFHHSEAFKRLSPQQQLSYNYAFHTHGHQQSRHSLTLEHLNICEAHPEYKSLIQPLHESPASFYLLSPEMQRRYQEVIGDTPSMPMDVFVRDLEVSSQNRWVIGNVRRLLSSHIELWQELSREKRTEYAVAFYENNQSPLPLEEAPIDYSQILSKLTYTGDVENNQLQWLYNICKCYPDSFREESKLERITKKFIENDFEVIPMTEPTLRWNLHERVDPTNLNANQLMWYRQLLSFNSSVDFRDLLKFNRAFSQNGVELLAPEKLEHTHWYHTRGSRADIALIYQMCLNNPFLLETSRYKSEFTRAFESFHLGATPTVEGSLDSLTEGQIRMMPKSEAEVWWNHFKENGGVHLDAVRNTAFFNIWVHHAVLRYVMDIDIDLIGDIELEMLDYSNGASWPYNKARLYHALFGRKKELFHALSFERQRQLNIAFKHHSLDALPYPITDELIQFAKDHDRAIKSIGKQTLTSDEIEKLASAEGKLGGVFQFVQMIQNDDERKKLVHANGLVDAMNSVTVEVIPLISDTTVNKFKRYWDRWEGKPEKEVEWNLAKAGIEEAKKNAWTTRFNELDSLLAAPGCVHQ